MAAFALLTWPLIALGLALGLGPRRGLIWGFLIGYLFLPEAYGFNLPGLPNYGKTTAVGIGSLICWMVAVMRNQDLPPDGAVVDRLPGRVMIGFLTLFLLSAVITVQTNQDAIVYPLTTLPGLGFRDYLTMASGMVIFLFPMWAAQALLTDETSHREVLIATLAMGAVYSLLILFELRMSPQLHTWVYGFFQHVWNQHERGGGYRPIVFLRHGLHVGLFLYVVLIAALALVRARDEGRKRMAFFMAGAFFFLILLASRNFGAALLAIMFVPVLLLTGKRVQLWVMGAVAAVMMAMPAIQQADLIQRDRIVSAIAVVAPNRAESLAFRFLQEERIMERAVERPAFGWGIWARWRYHDEQGRNLSVVDALWVSVLGENGWVGYIGFFGLLCAPLFLLGRSARRYGISASTLGIGMMLAGNLVYMISNAGGNPMTWLIVGALAGYMRHAPHAAPEGAEEGAAPSVEAGRDSPYRRYVGTPVTRMPDKAHARTTSAGREVKSPVYRRSHTPR